MKATAETRLKIKIIKERLQGILYPRVCPVCGKLLRVDFTELKAFCPGQPLPSGSGAIPARSFPSFNPYICPSCSAKLKRCAGMHGCLKCSRPLEDERAEYCPECLRADRQFDLGLAALIHDEAAGGMMYDLKYHALRCNAEPAAFEMAAALAATGGRSGSPLLDADVIIPVPLHKKREFERGYNQAEVLAQEMSLLIELSFGVSIPVDSSYLVRTLDTPRLKTLVGADRAAGLSGAFRVAGEAGRYKKILLVDDIFTTGTTLNECAKTLRQAGVAVIYFITATIGA